MGGYDDMPPLVDRPGVGWGGQAATAGGGGWGPPAGSSSWGQQPATGYGGQAPGASSGWQWSNSNDNSWGNGGATARSSTPFIPPPPGATYESGGWGSTPAGGAWGAPQNGGDVGGWSEDAGQTWGSWGQEPNAAAAGGFSAASAFAPQPMNYPQGYDAMHYASLRQQTMSAPPDASYNTPSWVSSAYTKPSLLAPMARPTSSMANAQSFQSFASPYSQNIANYSPASTLGSAGYKTTALPDRPSEWRRDFSMKSGLQALLPRTRRQSIGYGENSPRSRVRLHDFIAYNHHDPAVTYDLRTAPGTISFRAVARDVMASDLTRFACEPPSTSMRLYHPRLPWYIDVNASNPTGVNLYDLFNAIWANLRLPITRVDWQNEDMDSSDRDKIAHAWRVRCGQDDMEIGAGVRRMDFLRRNIVFEGLTKGKHGMWEMRTRKAVYSD